ncbi:MAG TPA: hypothetical protein VLB84_15715, partial [Bacteroidia bacterium]|nr:hypothetical protein [Bacteroidia bacterium]
IPNFDLDLLGVECHQVAILVVAELIRTFVPMMVVILQLKTHHVTGQFFIYQLIVVKDGKTIIDKAINTNE